MSEKTPSKRGEKGHGVRFDYRNPIPAVRVDITSTSTVAKDWKVEHTQMIEREEAQRVAEEAVANAKAAEIAARPKAAIPRKIQSNSTKKSATVTRKTSSSVQVERIGVTTHSLGKTKSSPSSHPLPTVSDFWPYPTAQVVKKPPDKVLPVDEKRGLEEIISDLHSITEESGKFADTSFTKRLSNLCAELTLIPSHEISRKQEVGNVKRGPKAIFQNSDFTVVQVSKERFRVSLLGREVVLTFSAMNLLQTFVVSGKERISVDTLVGKYGIQRKSVYIKVVNLIKDLNNVDHALGAMIKHEMGKGYYFDPDAL